MRESKAFSCLLKEQSMDEALLDKLRELTKEEQEILAGHTDINKELYMKPLSMTVDKNKLLEEGDLIQVRTHTRFTHFPKHQHNYVEVVYMCEGETVHIVNGERITLQKGEMLFLSQNAWQEILPARSNDIAINFIILPEFFDYALEMMAKEENLIRDFVVGCLRSEEDNIGYLHFKVADVLPIQNLVENLIWTLSNKQKNRRNINQITMGLLFLQLMNHTDKMNTKCTPFEQQLVFRILQYIDENYKEGELKKLAGQLNYDDYAMSRMIKKLTGKTYTELVQMKRLNQAAFLLTNTTLTISDISLAIGYDNISYFHRIFKKRYGVSPKSYKTCN